MLDFPDESGSRWRENLKGLQGNVSELLLPAMETEGNLEFSDNFYLNAGVLSPAKHWDAFFVDAILTTSLG